jgi:hypothetical protein
VNIPIQINGLDLKAVREGGGDDGREGGATFVPFIFVLLPLVPVGSRGLSHTSHDALVSSKFVASQNLHVHGMCSALFLNLLELLT